MLIRLEKVLEYAIQVQASDIYINEGMEVVLRIHGELSIIQSGIVDASDSNTILIELLQNDEIRMKKFRETMDIDFAYLFRDTASFRVNGFFSFWKMNFVLRRIALEAMTLKDLSLPRGVSNFLTLKDGLVLITGPTGSGKSTSMVTILEEINKTRKEHILTIEDPIEFVFKNKLSIISQRELANDTLSMANALKGSMREDPDIIMIGEMRDRETVEAAIELAGTGHLVISTLHTASAAQTISRLISFFPVESEKAIRDKLSYAIGWILCQRLIPRADGTGRVGIYELMLPASGVRNLIKEGEIMNLKSEIEMGTSVGMITMRHYADVLAKNGIIKPEDYVHYFPE